MKKILIVLIVLLCSLGFAQNLYTYTGETNVFYNEEVLSTGDTILVDEFIYLDDFTLTASTPTSIFMDVTTVSTSAAATTTVNVTELADVQINLDYTAGGLTLYFNSTTGNGIPITEDWEMILNTKYFNKILIKNTATTTSYTLSLKKILE